MTENRYQPQRFKVGDGGFDGCQVLDTQTGEAYRGIWPEQGLSESAAWSIACDQNGHAAAFPRHGLPWASRVEVA